MGYDAKVTTKGQITLPAKLREKLGIEAGDRIEFIEDGEGNISVVKKTNSFESLRGMIQLNHSVSSDTIDEWIAQARSAIGTRR